jgi:hypothetical protein
MTGAESQFRTYVVLAARRGTHLQEQPRFLIEAAAYGPRANVNLNLAHALLVAANGQPYGFLKVRSADLVREVELMAAAGLVEASLENTDTEGYAVINRVTDSGEAFLRAFKHQPPEVAEFASADH